MERRLTVVIDAGNTTCASKLGVFCPWMRTAWFGQQFLCGLFDHKELSDENGQLSGPGHLQRLRECLVAEGRNERGE